MHWERLRRYLNVNFRRHLRQAEHNRDVADALSQNNPVSLQWAVTCIFYAALHYVNAYLSYRIGRTPVNHGDRDAYVSLHMRTVFKDYRWLKTKSEAARYRLVEPTRRIFQDSRQRVVQIRRFVDGSLPRVN